MYFPAGITAVFRRNILAVCLGAIAIATISLGGAGPALAQGGGIGQLLQSVSPDMMQKLQEKMGGGSELGAQPPNNTPTIIQPAPGPGSPLVQGMDMGGSALSPFGMGLPTPPPRSRLERLMSRRAGVRLKQFGYDQLGVAQSVSVPQTGAIQDDYVLGPGDELNVTLRGQENAQYQIYVNRNGQVLLPKLSPISASGRTLGAVRADVQAAIARAYVSTEGYVSVADVRQVSVLVSGEVNNPGSRILTGLSTPVDAILISGGIKKTGSLRNVKLIRDGHVTSIDLYSVLTQSGSSTHVMLRDGDRIVVPPLGRTVVVAGWVRRPRIYELPPGSTAISVRGLLGLAGGTEVRGKYRMSVLRLDKNGQNKLETTSRSGTVGDSDVLYVLPAAAQTTGKATLSGGMALAGRYAVGQDTMLSEIIKSPGALGPSPYTLIGLISRRDPKTYLRTLVAFSPIAVLNGTSDMALRSDDIVRILSIDEAVMVRKTMELYELHQTAAEEAARNPEATVGNINDIFNGNVAAQGNGAGGGAEQAASGKGRRPGVHDQAALAAAAAGGNAGGNARGNAAGNTGTNSGIANVDSSMAQSALASASQSAIGPASQDAVVQRLANQRLGQNVDGSAQAPVAENLEEENVAAGSIAFNQTVSTFGQLATQLGVSSTVLANFIADHTVHIGGAVRGPGSYPVGPGVSLQDVVQAAGGTLDWADQSGVELTTTKVDRDTGKAVTRRVTLPLRNGMLADYIVQPRDEVRFHKVFANVDVGSVTLQGQVRFPGTYQISRGEHLSDLLMRAGGLTDVAFPYGTVFLRRSVAALEATGFRRSAVEINNQLLVAMTNNSDSRMSPNTFAALQGFVKDLRDTKPLGRISVTADPSVLLAHPASDVLLEPSDVIYIPQRPSTVAVLGRVLQPGSFPFQPGLSVEDYIAKAGGYSQFADEGQTFVILPDGTARRVDSSWLNFDEPSIPPGSAVVVPRDLTPLNFEQLLVDTTKVVGQLAVSAASLAVVSRQ